MQDFYLLSTSIRRLQGSERNDVPRGMICDEEKLVDWKKIEDIEEYSEHMMFEPGPSLPYNLPKYSNHLDQPWPLYDFESKT